MADLREYLPGQLTVVKGHGLVADDLVVLVPLPCDKHDVPAPGTVDCRGDSLAAVHYQPVLRLSLLKAGFDLREDLLRIFTPRVIRGSKHKIAQARGDVPHYRAFGLVPVSPASENSDDFVVRELQTT